MVSVPADQAQVSPQFQEALIRADRATVVATLARGIAHDLRGPLQTLNLLVDPHADLLANAEGARFRGAMSDSVRHLADTVSRFSQIYGPPDTEPAPVIVDDILGDVVDLQRYQRGLPAAEVDLRLAAGLAPVRGMEGHLRHLLLSLVINAKEALTGREDGQILLAAQAVDRAVVLTVEDNGEGLTPEGRRRAFEPFFSTRGDNLGLGLSVARWLAARQGGTVELCDGARVGTRVAVTLPVWRRGA
jgi:signal transduction histidine kinase